ncbi:hypothetical protein HPB50_027820 [Hyalomma asiaticum]|nr:hypothetical protein HPB50_027820 [Hyalomma asiaticum]
MQSAPPAKACLQSGRRAVDRVSGPHRTAYHGRRPVVRPTSSTNKADDVVSSSGRCRDILATRSRCSGEQHRMADASAPFVDLSLKAVLEDGTDHMMNLLENRIATFDCWPLRGSSVCSPRRMAEAGFYYCPTETDPDLARCYVCFKELVEWEPGDDPFQEHACYTDCPFVALGMKKEKDITLREFIYLERERLMNRVNKLARLLAAEVEELIWKTISEHNEP